MNTQKLLDRESKIISPALGWDFPLAIKEARGATVTTLEGEEYLDFTCGTAVTNIGHNHPKVVEAAKAQIDAMVHAGCAYHYESLVGLGERLAEITPGKIGKFFFSNSGAEAVEGCLKLAKYVTQRPAIISFTGAFHGRTLGTVSVTTSNAKYRDRYRPLIPEIYFCPFPNAFRGPYKGSEDAAGASAYCMDYLENTILKYQVNPEQVAAILVEPVQGEGGYLPMTSSLAQGLRALCDKHGIMLIFDEVQSGMGRTAAWFAAEHLGMAPDIMAIAKGIASGFPVSAVASTPEIMDQWSPGAHGTTFGGSPVSCAAACATIDVIKDENLLEHAKKISALAFERLNGMKGKYDIIGDVRGYGLMIGVEFIKPGSKDPHPEAFATVHAHAFSEKFLFIGCGMNGNIVRFIPPLIATEDQINRSLDIIEAGIKKVS